MAQNMMNVTEAKRDFLKLVRDIAAGAGPVVLLRNGKPIAQLSGIDEQEMLLEGAQSRRRAHAQGTADRTSKTTAYGFFSDHADAAKRAREKDAWSRACEVKHGHTA